MSGAIPDGLSVIILAGGRANRLGGVDKPAIEVGGVSLLERVVAAASVAGCAPILIVGAAASVPPPARAVAEPEPRGGPVSAIGLALPLASTPTVLVLAADLPWAHALVPTLVDGGVAPGSDGACAVDDDGRSQWLAGLYRTESLRRALGTLPDGGRDASVRALVGTLTLDAVATPPGATDDLDRWQDVWQARRRANAGPASSEDRREPSMSTSSARTLPPEALDEWAAAVRAELGLRPEHLPTAAILDLARDVANGVARPAAPFSAFAAGLAAGLRGGDAAAIEAALATVTALAADWTPDSPAPGTTA